MAGIFISYRREDSQALAGRLSDRLGRRFGADRVFRDIDTIDPGARFAEVIGERIGGCDVLVALIGKAWLDAQDADGRRRLDLPHDFVKAEIAAALAQDKLVIPVLIEGAAMPARDSLPQDLAQLAERNALPVGDSRFDYDVGRLISVIEKVLAPQGEAAAPAGRRGGLREPRTLAFLGGGIAILMAVAWTAYWQLAERPQPPDSTVTATKGGIAAGGNVSATAAPGGVAVVATGPVTIGITLEQYEERIKKLERELRAEFTRTSQTDKDRIALLEKQLAAAKALTQAPEQGLAKFKEVLAGARASLEQLGPRAKIPAEALDRARRGLARGDTIEAERLFEKVLGEDKPLAAEAAYQLGRLAESRIDYATATKYFAEAIKLAPENPQYLSAAGNLAFTLGRYEDARPLLEQALEIGKKTLGLENPNVATSINDLATVYYAQGRYLEAEALLKQSLAIRTKVLGGKDPAVAASLNNLAELYRAQGRYEEAEPHYLQALQILQEALGHEHTYVASSLNNLAMLYYAQRQYVQAAAFFKQSLTIQEKVLGSEDPLVATTLNNLAEVYRTQRRYADAEPLYERSLAIWRKAFGSDEHPAVANGLNNLALLYYDQRQFAKAEPLYQQALAVRKRTLAPEHPDLAVSLHNLAQLYGQQGRYAEAEPLFQQSIAIMKKALGLDHPSVAILEGNYAEFLASRKRGREAADLQSQPRR